MRKNQSFEERAALLRSEDRRYRSLGSVHHNKCKVYKRRWYILAVFSVVAALNNLIWNTWGPIQGTSQVVFGWDSTTITLLADWGPISFVVAVVPMCWLMDVKGLRVAVLVAVFCEFIGAGLRCIPVDDDHLGLQTGLIHLGQFITGIGGPIAMAAAPMVSAAWFPPEQRTTATAISSLACYSGTALSFVIGPLLVPDVEEYAKQAKLNITSVDGEIPYVALRKHFNQTVIDSFKDKIIHLMYLELGVTALTMLFVIIHFPERPKLPPSVTAATGRLEFSVGAKSLLKNGQFWLLVFIYGIGTGVYGGWCSILDLNLSQFQIDQKTAGWLGFGAVVAGSVSGISLSIFADHFTRYMKLIVIALLAGATASLTVFTLICANKIIPYSKIVLFITSILGGFFVNGSIPLFFELAVESTYPVAEGITSGFLTFSNNFLQIIFYIFPMIPNFGLKWINWCTFATTALCIPLLMLWQQRRYRSDVDAKDSYIPAPHNKELSTEANYTSESMSSNANGFPAGYSIQTNSYGTNSFPNYA